MPTLISLVPSNFNFESYYTNNYITFFFSRNVWKSVFLPLYLGKNLSQHHLMVAFGISLPLGLIQYEGSSFFDVAKKRKKDHHFSRLFKKYKFFFFPLIWQYIIWFNTILVFTHKAIDGIIKQRASKN